MNQNNNNNNEFKGFDENSRIVINDTETGQQNTSNNRQTNNLFTRIQNYLLSLTERLQISSNMKLFLLCLLICAFNFFFFVMSLPFIFITPSRILSYLSFGNILLILSLLFYYGSNRFFGFLRDGKRFRITLIHILLIICGLFFPLFQGYLFSFILDVALILTTVMFILTIIPGGQRGINAIQSSLIAFLPQLFKNLKK